MLLLELIHLEGEKGKEILSLHIWKEGRNVTSKVGQKRWKFKSE